MEYDGKVEKHFGLIAALGNGKQFGGGITMFPHAEIDDGYLDLVIVDYISKPKMISAFFKLLSGKVDKIKKVTFATFAVPCAGGNRAERSAQTPVREKRPECAVIKRRF